MDKTREKPFTWAAFRIWATRKHGVSDEEAKKERDRHRNPPKLDQDQLGLGSVLRLYIPGFLSWSWGRKTYADNRQEEGSKPIKDPDDKAWQTLKDRVHR